MGAVIYGRLHEHSLVVDWVDANGMRAPAEHFSRALLTRLDHPSLSRTVIELCVSNVVDRRGLGAP
jgi:hypothetical protein